MLKPRLDRKGDFETVAAPCLNCIIILFSEKKGTVSITIPIQIKQQLLLWLIVSVSPIARAYVHPEFEIDPLVVLNIVSIDQSNLARH